MCSSPPRAKEPLGELAIPSIQRRHRGRGDFRVRVGALCGLRGKFQQARVALGVRTNVPKGWDIRLVPHRPVIGTITITRHCFVDVIGEGKILGLVLRGVAPILEPGSPIAQDRIPLNAVLFHGVEDHVGAAKFELIGLWFNHVPPEVDAIPSDTEFLHPVKALLHLAVEFLWNMKGLGAIDPEAAGVVRRQPGLLGERRRGDCQKGRDKCESEWKHNIFSRLRE